MGELVLEEKVAIAALLEVHLHLLGHLKGILAELSEPLLEDAESVVHQSLMLTQSLHHTVELLLVALEVVVAASNCPLQAVDLLLEGAHAQPDFGDAQLVLGFLSGWRATQVARWELVSWRSRRTSLMYF